MARSPITETLARVRGMIAYVQENLNPGEFDLFLDMVDPHPEPEQEKPKRTRVPRTGLPPAASASTQKEPTTDKEPKCVICAHGKDYEDHQPGSKSYHEFEAGPTAVKKSGVCAKTVGEWTCGLPEDNPLHHDSVYRDYHPFEPSKSVTRAGRKSKPKPGEMPSVPSSESGG